VEYVDPIRYVEQIDAMKDILQKHSQRDLLFFVLGINTGMKISDLLSLKVEDVWDGTKMKEFLFISDDRSGKKQAYYLNNRVNMVLDTYLNQIKYNSSSDYLFKSKKNDQPITRQQAYRIIHNAAMEAGVTGNIGTHTLRKTFGYHALQKGIAISILMSVYHHQSPAETLRYIGIEKYEKHLIKVDVNL
jgi:site-specific recombinase XerD